MNNSDYTSTDTPESNLSNVVKNQDTIIDQIRRALSCLGYSQLNDVLCAADGDEVTLTGRLDSFYLKQVAQSVAMKVPGVRQVRNHIQVQ